MRERSRRSDFFRNGLEPEFVIDDILDYDFVGRGAMVRLYVGTKRRDGPALQYMVDATPHDLLRMARQLEIIAAEAIDCSMRQDYVTYTDH